MSVPLTRSVSRHRVDSAVAVVSHPGRQPASDRVNGVTDSQGSVYHESVALPGVIVAFDDAC